MPRWFDMGGCLTDGWKSFSTVAVQSDQPDRRMRLDENALYMQQRREDESGDLVKRAG